MDAQKVDMFIVSNAKYFPSEQIPFIKERLLELDESKWIYLQSATFKDPTTYLLVSIFLGYIGVDRFMLGETGLGVAKLITLGGCYIWWLIDLFSIIDRTRKKNMETLQTILVY